MWLGKGREIIKPPGSKTEKEPYGKYLIVFTDIAANYAKQLLNDVELKEKSLLWITGIGFRSGDSDIFPNFRSFQFPSSKN